MHRAQNAPLWLAQASRSFLSVRSSRLAALLAACLLFIAAAASGRAETINFDDIDATAGDVILGSYQSYTWTNFSAYTGTPGFPGFNAGVVSGPNAAYAAGDALGATIVSKITSPGDFNFQSAYLGSGWYDGLSVTLIGLLNGTQEFTQTVTVDTTGAKLFSFNFTGINELDIISTVSASTTDPYSCGPSGCSQVTLDDLTLTPASGSLPVTPEPISFLLAGLGLCIFAVARRTSRPVSL
jgi:hypothetical protein